MEAFSIDRNRLAQANKAMELDGPYATLKEFRKQHASDKEALSNEDLKIPEMKSAIESQKEHLINADQKLTDIKSKQKIMSEIFKKVRHKDHQLIDKKKIIEESQRDIEKNSAEINTRNYELTKKGVNRFIKTKTRGCW